MLHARQLAPLLAAALLLGGCSESRPWLGDDAQPAKEAKAPEPRPAAPLPEPATPPADAPTTGDAVTDGDAPTSSPAAPAAEQAQRNAIRQDRQARLLLRTAVSILEGCHAGRADYSQCDEQDELGPPEQVGITLGEQLGQVKLTASPNAFRVSTVSASGNRFTVARSPSGERLRCLRSDPAVGGACPPDGNWNW